MLPAPLVNLRNLDRRMTGIQSRFLYQVIHCPRTRAADLS